MGVMTMWRLWTEVAKACSVGRHLLCVAVGVVVFVGCDQPGGAGSQEKGDQPDAGRPPEQVSPDEVAKARREFVAWTTQVEPRIRLESTPKTLNEMATVLGERCQAFGRSVEIVGWDQMFGVRAVSIERRELPPGTKWEVLADVASGNDACVRVRGAIATNGVREAKITIERDWKLFPGFDVVGPMIVGIEGKNSVSDRAGFWTGDSRPPVTVTPRIPRGRLRATFVCDPRFISVRGPVEWRLHGKDGQVTPWRQDVSVTEWESLASVEYRVTVVAVGEIARVAVPLQRGGRGQLPKHSIDAEITEFAENGEHRVDFGFRITCDHGLRTQEARDLYESLHLDSIASATAVDPDYALKTATTLYRKHGLVSYDLLWIDTGRDEGRSGRVSIPSQATTGDRILGEVQYTYEAAPPKSIVLVLGRTKLYRLHGRIAPPK